MACVNVVQQSIVDMRHYRSNGSLHLINFKPDNKAKIICLCEASRHTCSASPIAVKELKSIVTSEIAAYAIRSTDASRSYHFRMVHRYTTCCGSLLF